MHEGGARRAMGSLDSSPRSRLRASEKVVGLASTVEMPSMGSARVRASSSRLSTNSSLLRSRRPAWPWLARLAAHPAALARGPLRYFNSLLATPRGLGEFEEHGSAGVLHYEAHVGLICDGGDRCRECACRCGLRRNGLAGRAGACQQRCRGAFHPWPMHWRSSQSCWPSAPTASALCAR